MYLQFLGRTLWIERESPAFKPEPWFHHVYRGGEHFIWLGRLHVIFTPRDWRERRAAESAALMVAPGVAD